MTRLQKYVFTCILLFVFALLQRQTINADGIIETKLRLRVEKDIKGLKLTARDKFMEVLAIKPGMTILDIGTGTGQFAFEFARILSGTGKVFATDIDTSCINYVKEEAARRGLANLHPILVKKQGVDEFYSKNKYDLITLIHVSIMHKPDLEYFREMRGFLEKDGRLIVVFHKTSPPFSPGDFTGDFKGLIRELSLEPDDSPFYKSLREPTKKLLRQNSKPEADEKLKSALIEDFNQILSDNRFGMHFVNGKVFKKGLVFYPDERDFADSLLLSMIYKNNFSRNKNNLHAEEIKDVARLNKLLILQKFRRYLHGNRMFTSMQSAKIRYTFEKAGYELLEEHADVIPFEDILVFKATGNAAVTK